MSEQEVLLSALSEGVLTLTLNRPEALNSFNRELLDALSLAIEEAHFNTDARVVILTGGAGK